MQCFVLFSLLIACAWAVPIRQYYSYSTAVGSGSGNPYTITGEGRITAVRIWDYYGGHIYGLQLRYEFSWSQIAGYQYGTPLEMVLYDDEAIIQVSGKYAHYIQSLVFTTNRGRSIYAGQPSGNSFNMYPEHREGELHFLSGRYHGGLTSIGAHWAVVYTPENYT